LDTTDKHILVADDDDGILSMLTDLFETSGYKVSKATNGAEVIGQVQKNKGKLDALLMDIQMPGMDGINVLKQLQSGGNDIPTIIMTAFGSGSIVMKAMQQGAFDFITKPFVDIDTVLHKVERLLEHDALAREVSELKSKITQGEKIIGNSPAMLEIYKVIGKVANSDATILITGETGTGKELVANVIHSTSRYSKGPFVAVNCGALPETLLESELFGYESGAFTGATKMRKGRFEMADKGTIFLDEVGEMTMSTQRKLLRVLQERVVDRLGGTLPIKIDVRVISATNRSLEDEVEKNNFRADLFFRLNVVSVHMPPLRERKEDIPLLIDFFLDKHRYNPGSPPSRISNDAIQLLNEYDFPGNVRELENIVQRAVVDSRGRTITGQNLNLSKDDRANFGSGMISVEKTVRDRTTLDKALSKFEKLILVEGLRQSNNDEEATAELLGIKVDDLRQRMEKYAL
jgi:two-component system, NtrC family, response regulator AtoC